LVWISATDRFEFIRVPAYLLDFSFREDNLPISKPMTGRDLPVLSPTPKRLTRYSNVFRDFGSGNVHHPSDFSRHL